MQHSLGDLISSLTPISAGGISLEGKRCRGGLALLLAVLLPLTPATMD